LSGAKLARLQHIGDALHGAGLREEAVGANEQLSEDDVVVCGLGV